MIVEGLAVEYRAFVLQKYFLYIYKIATTTKGVSTAWRHARALSRVRRYNKLSLTNRAHFFEGALVLGLPSLLTFVFFLRRVITNQISENKATSKERTSQQLVASISMETEKYINIYLIPMAKNEFIL